MGKHSGETTTLFCLWEGSGTDAFCGEKEVLLCPSVQAPLSLQSAPLIIFNQNKRLMSEENKRCYLVNPPS